MKKLAVFLLTLAAIAGGIGWFLLSPASPREVNFVRVRRETLVSNLITNAKLEPLEFASVRSEREGALARVLVEKGQRVAAGQTLVELDSTDARAGSIAAGSRVAQVNSELQLDDRGPSPVAVAEVESGLSRVEVDLDLARKQAATIERLVEKNAEPRSELVTVRDRIRSLEAERESLRMKRAALSSIAGREGIEARLRDAESAAALARERIEQAAVKSPISGVLYNLAVRKGGYVRAGDLIADVGRTEVLRAVVYVDEPELGRVSAGMPVKLTWDALAGREWKGKVEKMPTQIVALNTRQVGEVLCRWKTRTASFLRARTSTPRFSRG